MYVLVDYANVKRLFRGKGLKAMVVGITEKVCELVSDTPSRLEFRLYGGWYQDQKPTHLAQSLVTEARAEFPILYTPLKGAGKQNRIRVLVELAYSMLIDPSHNLIRTVRERNDPHRSIKVNSPKTYGCTRTDCFLKGIAGFFRKGHCTHQSCRLTSSDLIGSKREQKLVDTMLSTDMVHASITSDTAIVLVSSDDDMVPAVRQSLLIGAKVIHLHTGARSQTPPYYIGTTFSNYQQASL